MVARVSKPRSNQSLAQPDRVKVPNWDLDPVSSLQPHPVVLHLNGHEAQVPAMTAAEWLTILMDKEMDYHDFMDLIPDFEEHLLAGDIEVEEIQDLVLSIVTLASARQWWITFRLIGVARAHWDVIGPEMMTKIDVTKVSLAAWLGVLTTTLIHGIEPKNVNMFVAQIAAPPPGTTVPVEGKPKELTASEFLAMAG